MADVWITEYARPALTNGVGVPAGEEPSLAVQKVTFTTTTQSAALNAKTTFVRLKADGDFHFKVGNSVADTPTATTNDTPVSADVAEYFGAAPGVKIAFVEA